MGYPCNAHEMLFKVALLKSKNVDLWEQRPQLGEAIMAL